MRHIDNWDAIEERQSGEFARPTPGGYIAVIVNVEDDEDKQYLRIEWDFAEGEFKGYNAATFSRAAFWPTTLFRSYKDSALGFFKAFKTAVELSNPGYTFDDHRPKMLAGKVVGVVLGEEEYIGNSGETKTRLYVCQTRSVKAIRDGDFKTPELKRLKATQTAAQFHPCNGGDDDCPF